MFDLRAENLVDLAQTVVLAWALFMVRHVYREGVKLLRENLDRLHAVEVRLDRLEEARQDHE